MIHCIVSRRLGRGRKAQGPRLVVPETPSSILPEFHSYSSEENVLSNRRLSLAYEGHGGAGAFSQQPGVFSLQGITVDGRPTMLDDAEEKGQITTPTERPGRSEKTLSKHFIAPSARRNRRASLHGCDFRSTHGFSTVESDAVLHPKEVLYLQKIALASNEETRRTNLSNGMAHISLDGRIMDAVNTTSSATIGGNLGEEEARAWDCFAPLQRVLIVAVAAAAAASNKHRNHKEINRLQKAVKSQEDALSLMRRELSNLWDQVATEEDGPLPFVTPKQIDIDRKSSSESPMTPACERDAPHPENPLIKTPETRKRQAKYGLANDSLESCDPLIDDPINKGVLLIEHSSVHRQAVQSGDAKWYSNPLIEHSGRSEDSNHSEHYFEDCTPEKRRRIFSRFTIDDREPIEWMSVKSSFTTITDDAITPLTNRKRFSFEDANALSNSLDLESSNLEEMAALKARCATILVEVKNQVLLVLDKEASQVMAALSHVIEKAQKLEKLDRTSPWSRHAGTPKKTAEASAALKQSVEKASSQVESLQAAVVSIWHTIGPHALASLKLSPRELESLLRRATQLTSEKLLSGSEKAASASEEGIQEWNHWLQIKHGEAMVPSLLSKIEAAANISPRVDIQAVCSPSWKLKGNEIATAVGVAVRRTADSLMASLDGREVAENFESPMAKQRVVGLSIDTPQFVAQRLLEELEKAAAKIAGMEYQMVSLKQSVRESETQREKAELKLAEAIARDHQNQEKFEIEMNDLTTKLREKESAYDALMRSRKVMFLVKSKEIAELKKDCQMRDVALDDITAAAQATREASDQRLTVLEDICRRKDSAIRELKKEIVALEDKVQELELRSPLLLRGKGRRSASILQSAPDKATSLEDKFNGICRQREQMQDPPKPHDFVALEYNIDDTSSHPQSSSFCTAADKLDFRSAALTPPELQTHNCRFYPRENLLPNSSTMAENATRVRSSTSSLPNRAKEFTSSGKPLAVSTDGNVFPNPDATFFDDFLEVESSLQALEADDWIQLNDGFSAPSNGNTLRCSQEYVTVKSKRGSGLQQLKNMTIGTTVPESAGSHTRVTNSQLPRGKVFFTAVDENKMATGVLRPTKASSLKALGKSSGHKKEKEKETSGSRAEEEINWVDAEVLTSLEFNGSLDGSITSRRTSIAPSDIKENLWKQTSKENKITRKSRWL